MHMSMAVRRSRAVRSSLARKRVETASSASSGQDWNQSIVQQLTIEGNFRMRFRNASPIGDMANTICS